MLADHCPSDRHNGMDTIILQGAYIVPYVCGVLYSKDMADVLTVLGVVRIMYGELMNTSKMYCGEIQTGSLCHRRDTVFVRDDKRYFKGARDA